MLQLMIFIGGSHDHLSYCDPKCEVWNVSQRHPPIRVNEGIPRLSMETYLRTSFHCGHDGGPETCNTSHYVTFYRHESLSPADALQLLIDHYAKK